MDCGCNKKLNKKGRGFPKAVVEITNPERLVLFRKVSVAASLGTEEEFPPAIGKYYNVLLAYEANGHVYMYSSDGIPTLITTDVDDLRRKIDELGIALEEETAARIEADGALSSSIDSLSSSLSAETAAREAADTALQNALTAEQTARAAADTALASDITAETNARSAADTALGSRIDGVASDLATEVTNRTNADTALGNRVTAIEAKIPTQATAQNQLADKSFVNSSISTNTANYISNNGQPFTSVAQLEAYTGPVTNNDYAFVVGTDAAGNTTYTRYKYVADQGQWSEEYVLNNSSFTSSQWATINSGITSGDVTKLNGLANIKTVGTNLSLDANGNLTATDTTYTAGTGLSLSGTQFSIDNTVALKSELPTVNDATLTIQKNGSTVDTFTANSATNKTVNITVPTNNNELTNGAGYQTAADVAAAISAITFTANEWDALWA